MYMPAHIPALFAKELPEVEVEVIGGSKFSRNVWNNTQAIKVQSIIESGQVSDNDIFLFMDSNSSGIVQTRRLLADNKLKSELHIMWSDFGVPYIKDMLKTHTKIADVNWFPTEDMLEWWADKMEVGAGKMKVTGWPLEYITTVYKESRYLQRRNKIFINHQLTTKNQRDLVEYQYKHLERYGLKLWEDNSVGRKYEYSVQSAKLVVSLKTAYQFDFSIITAFRAGAIMIAPDTFINKKILNKFFLYPKDWIDSPSQDSWDKFKSTLLARFARYEYKNPYKDVQKSKGDDLITSENLLYYLRQHYNTSIK